MQPSTSMYHRRIGESQDEQDSYIQLGALTPETEGRVDNNHGKDSHILRPSSQAENSEVDNVGIIGDEGGCDRFWEQFHAFRAMAMPYFRESRSGRCLFAVMVLLTLLNCAVRVIFSYLVKDFWTALSEKNEDVFTAVMWKFILALLVLVPINVFYRCVISRRGKLLFP